MAVFMVSALALSAGGAIAAKPPKPPKPPNPAPAPAPAPAPKGGADLTIAAKPNPVVFGRSTVISGRLKNGAGQVVVIEENPHPYTGGFKPGRTATTASNGDYSFTLAPKLNTRYRVSTQANPPVRSAEVLVQVQIRISLRLSDSTPRAGSLVRFSGSAAPAHDGRTVEIQRLRRTGGYATIAKTALKDAGTTRSVYSRRIRVSRTGTFRAQILSDGDHATGFSSPRTARL
ncbi:MAG: hypothetical protein H0T15_02540 [Thermoleophilaceae bacterium]|nr:hypothetical protein [Thermoleophilaceae bacterium]